MTFAMARDGQFFKTAGKVHPKFQTPGNALLVHLGVMIVMVLSGSFFILADMYIFIVWTFNLMLMIGLFILRKKMPDKERPYRVWGYPWIPILVIYSMLFISSLPWLMIFKIILRVKQG
jgi:APA family basic amino acid/polyamine antiporter